MYSPECYELFCLIGLVYPIMYVSANVCIYYMNVPYYSSNVYIYFCIAVDCSIVINLLYDLKFGDYHQYSDSTSV